MAYAWVFHFLLSNVGKELASGRVKMVIGRAISAPSSAGWDGIIGGQRVESPFQYTFKMSSMPPARKTPRSEVRIADSRNSPVSKNVAGIRIPLKPRPLRELHWYSNSSEGQRWHTRKAHMGIIVNDGRTRNMEFNANDAGFVPRVGAHYIRKTDDTACNFWKCSGPITLPTSL
jgi:oxalate decarboxylase/phosphoglucose isomerase-like protein (cupin superfamily)